MTLFVWHPTDNDTPCFVVLTAVACTSAVASITAATTAVAGVTAFDGVPAVVY